MDKFLTLGRCRVELFLSRGLRDFSFPGLVWARTASLGCRAAVGLMSIICRGVDSPTKRIVGVVAEEFRKSPAADASHSEPASARFRVPSRREGVAETATLSTTFGGSSTVDKVGAPFLWSL